MSSAGGPSGTTSVTNATCGTNNGQAGIAITGGTSPLTYSWSSGGSTPIENNLNSGTYTVTVSDANQCMQISTVTISEPSALSVSFSSVTISCNGDSNGEANAIANGGGSSGYTYLWDNGETNSLITGLNAGTYFLTVEDANCSITADINFNNPEPVLSPSLNDINLCYGDSILFIVDPQGGIVEWYADSLLMSSISSNSAFSPEIIQFDTTQTYYAIFIENGCRSNFEPVNAIIGDSLVASFTATPSSGTSPLFVEFTNTSVGIDTLLDYFEWSFGDGYNSNEFETENTYNSIGEFTAQLIVTDYYNGCSDSNEVKIITDGKSSLVIPLVFSPDGDGINDLFYVIQNNLLTLDVEIYNRWGEFLFEWEGVNGNWDGRTFTGEEAPAGTYFIIITASGLDEFGKEFTYGPKASAVTLVRGK